LSHFDPHKISSAHNFGQLWTSIVNIFGTDRDIDKRKTKISTTISSTFDKEDLVNFGPLNTKFSCLISTHPTAHGV